MRSVSTQINQWGKLTKMQIDSEISEEGPALGADHFLNLKFRYNIVDVDYDKYMVAYFCLPMTMEILQELLYFAQFLLSDNHSADEIQACDPEAAQSKIYSVPMDPKMVYEEIDIIVRDLEPSKEELERIKSIVVEKLQIGVIGSEFEKFSMDNLARIKQGGDCEYE